MSFKIFVSNRKSVFNELDNGLKIETRKNLKSQTEALVKDLKSVTPVDTGKARDSWKAEISEKGFKISNSVEYIERLNKGSSKQAPAHFVEKTALKYGEPVGSIVEPL